MNICLIYFGSVDTNSNILANGDTMQSQMKCTIPSLRLSQPADHKRTYRVFRDIKAALKFEQSRKAWRKPKCSKVQFGNDSRDVRYVVNYFGSNPRQRVKLSPARIFRMVDGAMLEVIAAELNKTQQQIS